MIIVKKNKVTMKKIDKRGRDADLTKYFDSVEVEVTNFEDYHELRSELREVWTRMCFSMEF
ncbi:hypothetical protein N186_08780 [Thermofilum adornatum]|uniref:Uncharacterized protein n=2 Tax=Thermofilum adornatum TaxID=1365176 RepID=S6A626_9CREN|nr:hypothetical protein N186_08780 [Thermofilum adornatum]